MRGSPRTIPRSRRWPDPFRPSAGRTEAADAVILAVADIHGAVGVHPDAMRPREPAGSGRAVGTVAFLARADHDLQLPGLRGDLPDRVALRVDEIDVPARGDRDPLGAGERGLAGGAAVAREALL